MDHYVSVHFQNFKAFKRFRLDLKHFNILAGPNNAGKSTILAAFRILAAGIRRATARKAQPMNGLGGLTMGYEVDLSAISIAEENIFHNYDDTQPAIVEFFLSKSKKITLYFPEQGKCFLIAEDNSKIITSPTGFRSHFNCSIGFVPILGPVEHHEQLYAKEAARLALFNYRAARNFRNIWHHFPEDFMSFRELLQQTWPSMDIERPVVEMIDNKPKLFMFCPEQRIPRELFWSGFGFQVWCQMLTYLIQSRNVSLFLIDEPDIYLHSELQRQLLNILRDLGPDILIATHSTEIITEADTNDLVLINKHQSSAKRIKNPSQLKEVFSEIGSILNPTLTQLAKTRRVLFVEGEDFKILSRIARRYNRVDIANRRDFAVISVEGFNPQKIRNLKEGIEATLGSKIVSAAIFDKDFRCEEECRLIESECKKFCDYTLIHGYKEIENCVLIPYAIEKAVRVRLNSQAKRTGQKAKDMPDINGHLDKFLEDQKSSILARLISERERFERSKSSTQHKTNIAQITIEEFDRCWKNFDSRIRLVGGKLALNSINNFLEEACGVNITISSIVDSLDEKLENRDLMSINTLLSDFVAHPLPVSET